MDETDRRILNILQAGFPVVPEPFAAVAREAGIGEAEVLARVGRMKMEGLIRRIGAIFESRKLDYVSTLCAARVTDDQEASFVAAVNAYKGVTHNYRRPDVYNIWFTVIAPSEEELQAFLEDIRKKTGIVDILCMRAVTTFKVNAHFEV
jgi:DNA-binding Lrp family transcriptional regulator